MRFPFSDRPRLWGVAVSHYQIEGNDPCDWTDWEQSGKTRGGACGAGVASWQRYERDAGLVSDAGANAFRFSISWSRVEPHRGEFDDEALLRYRRLVDRLNDLNIEPVVTLFHYTHPRWFHARTPWTSPASVEAFATYAARVVDALGPSVRCYVPLNEPLVFLLAGYFDAQIPPGLAEPRVLSRVFDHLLAAHAAAAAAIRARVPHAAIGIAHNMMGFVPERPWNPLDRFLSRTAHACYNRGLVEAFAAGKWNFLLPPSTVIRGSRPDLSASLDFFGVNYYSRLHLRCPGKTRAVGDFRYVDRSGGGLTDNGWEVVPEALPSLLTEAAAAGFPLMITENGVADARDSRRSAFLREHAAQIRNSPVPVHGYFHWSLLDNFEWLDGYEPKFGLYEVDRKTMERRPRPSVDTFRELGREFLSL